MFKEIIETIHDLVHGIDLEKWLREKEGRLWADKKRNAMLYREYHLKKLQTKEVKPRNAHEVIWANYTPCVFMQQLESDWFRAGFPGDAIRVRKEYERGMLVITNDIQDEFGKLIGTETTAVGPVLEIVH